MSIKVQTLDHIVLTVANIERTCEFYSQVLGMQVNHFNVTNAGGADRSTDAQRTALSFGDQKINLHEYKNEFTPRAQHPTPGSADMCLIAETPLNEVVTHLESNGVVIEIGPVPRTGARGKLMSVYIRDPDDNLVELSNYE
jgi:catechol 2,3-dioxygenase-like lactoylglutathione lyase family enzyme